MTTEEAQRSSIRERYVEGGLLGNLNPGTKAALLVVDLQKGFTDPRYAPGFPMEETIAATESLLEYVRSKQIPIWFTVIEFPEPGRGRGSVWLQKMPALKDLKAGEPSVELDKRMRRRPEDGLITKTTASAFAYTDLAEQLHAAGIDTVLIAGATTSGCIRATVVDACAADLAPFVIEECVADREPQPHRSALFDIEAKYGDVISLRDVPTILREEK